MHIYVLCCLFLMPIDERSESNEYSAIVNIVLHYQKQLKIPGMPLLFHLLTINSICKIRWGMGHKYAMVIMGPKDAGKSTEISGMTRYWKELEYTVVD